MEFHIFLKKTGDKLYTLFVVGQIIPFHAVMIAISMLSTKLGLTNTHLGLIIFYSGFYTSFGVMTYVGFLKSVPRELEEAAAIDGGTFQNNGADYFATGKNPQQ